MTQHYRVQMSNFYLMFALTIQLFTVSAYHSTNSFIRNSGKSQMSSYKNFINMHNVDENKEIGIIIVDHGSRRSDANNMLLEVANSVLIKAIAIPIIPFANRMYRGALRGYR